MWAMTPWYLLRSLVSASFAFLLAMGTAVVLLTTTYSMGAANDDALILGSFPPNSRIYILYFVAVALYLLILWLVPWGAATRRGGAHILNSFTPSDNGRRNLVMAMLGVGAVFFVLTFAGALPIPSLVPFGS